MSLATKYRPKTFEEMTEQSVITEILTNQIKMGDIKNCYLFNGPAGCGKTTSGRLFANMINGGSGVTIELDAASHSSVEDIRKLVADSRYKPIGQPYKVFLIDECHSLSNQAWQALLTTLEEPTPTSVFILCTTDPQKIPPTIISRVQRFSFKKISYDGIIKRLKHIIEKECEEGKEYTYEDDALAYIAKLSEGGMRDAITLMEKALCFTSDLNMASVAEALGTVDYKVLFRLTDALCKMDKGTVIEIVEDIYRSGFDLKQFIKNYNYFVLDLCKYAILGNFEYLQIPNIYESEMSHYTDQDFVFFNQLLGEVINLSSSIKWEATPKPVIESTFILLCTEA